ncbi:MAG: ferredoxin [Phycisphaerales bacterium]|nr:ferredoxin [Phycisphaerales bacterium]
MSKYKIEIDRNLCIGDGACVGEAPNTFEMDADNIAIVKDVGGHTDEEILQAAQVCPVDAIILTDANSGEKVWPKS